MPGISLHDELVEVSKLKDCFESTHNDLNVKCTEIKYMSL